MTTGFGDVCGWGGPVLAVLAIVAMWVVVVIAISALFPGPSG